VSNSLTKVREPWSFEDIKKAYWSNFSETKEIIEDTEGGRLWRALLSLNESVWVLDSCTSDLLDEVSDFAHQTTKSGFWNELNRSQQELFSRKVNKYLFCAASAAMALVDHARKFDEKYPCPDFKREVTKRFGNSGMHEFVKDLRNYVAHWRITKANWNVAIDYVQKSQKAVFILKRQELLEWGQWKPSAKKYIESSGDKIDIYNLIREYNDIAEQLYRWHKAKILATWTETLSPYFRYKKSLNQIQNRWSWNLVISHIPEGKDPYEYLGRYLTDDQMEEVFSFEYKSVEQIDRLIELLDTHGSCDEELRATIHRILGNQE